MKIPYGIAAAIVAAVVLGSCAGPRALDDRMFDHFGRAAEIQSSLLVGDLEGARRPARWLAEHPLLDDPTPATRGWFDEVRTAATSVAEAGSVDEAADATGRLAAACAGCHTASDDGPRFRSMADAPEGEALGTHMVRHLWAMDRMWEGLIGASAETWQLGARVLAEDEPGSDFAGGSAAGALARAVHDQAARAERTPLAERPEAYADLMKTCAGCHALSGVARD